jgi:hypothetical protein
MRPMRNAVLAAAALLIPLQAQAQAPAAGTVPVSADNFVRAESDLYLSNVASLPPSTTRRSSASIATPSTRLRCSTSMLDR